MTIDIQTNAFKREIAEIQKLRHFFMVSELSLSALYELRGSIIPEAMLTPPVVHHNYGYVAPKPDFAEDTAALAFTAGVKHTTTGSIIFLDTPNFQLYLPSGVNRGVIAEHLRGITDRINGQLGHMNHLLANFPDIWNTSSANLQHAYAQQFNATAAGLSEQDLVRYSAQLKAAADKVHEKETIHAAMEKIKAFVDETLEYLRKNSKVS